MRLRVCTGLLLLGTLAGGCAHLPERVRVEVGDKAVEVSCPARPGP